MIPANFVKTIFIDGVHFGTISPVFLDDFEHETFSEFSEFVKKELQKDQMVTFEEVLDRWNNSPDVLKNFKTMYHTQHETENI